MVGSDELRWQQAAGHRLWSSSEDCTDTKHRQEFLLPLDVSKKNEINDNNNLISVFPREYMHYLHYLFYKS